MAEPLNATFFLFRKRRPGGVVARATFGFAAGAALLIAGFIGLSWNAWAALFGIFAQLSEGVTPSNDPAPVLGMLAIFGWGFLFLLLFYFLMAAYEAACLRWLVRREQGGGVMGLTFDADMWRVYAGYWLWFGISFAISLAVSMLLTPIYFFMAPSIISGASGEAPNLAALFTIQIVSVLARLVVTAYFAVRFAPGNATSIAMRRFAYFDAWKVTTQRSWALFGSFSILWLIGFAISLVVWAVTLASFIVQIVATWWQAIVQPDAANVEAMARSMLSPQMLAPLAIGYAAMLIVWFVLAAAFFGVNARAAIAAAQEGKIDATLPDTIDETFA